MNVDLTSSVHFAFVEPLLHEGRAPSAQDVATRLGISVERVRDALSSLEASHGAVLHPHVAEPWILHPFSLSPTATWVETGTRGWWAPCLWCACGIATLAREPVTIHTRIAGEADDVDIHVEGGRVREADLMVHFAVPPRAAWDNVQHFCATVLPFRSTEQVHGWSARHALSLGAVIPIQQCLDLGREWYAQHADPAWRKWSVREATEIFAKVGLVDSFWSLPETDGGF